MSKGMYKWVFVYVKDIKVGNMVEPSAYMVQSIPRKITKVIKHKDGTFSLFDEFGVYKRNASGSSKLKVVHYSISNKPGSYRKPKNA
jgi:hypothetical protein